MKRLFYIFLLSFIFSSEIFAYVDMSARSARASDLGMRNKDYSYAMALLGIMNGTMLGLFLWKTK